jgi:hypothetical protein
VSDLAQKPEKNKEDDQKEPAEIDQVSDHVLDTERSTRSVRIDGFSLLSSLRWRVYRLRKFGAALDAYSGTSWIFRLAIRANDH